MWLDAAAGDGRTDRVLSAVKELPFQLKGKTRNASGVEYSLLCKYLREISKYLCLSLFRLFRFEVVHCYDVDWTRKRLWNDVVGFSDSQRSAGFVLRVPIGQRKAQLQKRPVQRNFLVSYFINNLLTWFSVRLDCFSIKVAEDLGEIKSVTVRHDNSGAQSSWYLKKVIYMVL